MLHPAIVMMRALSRLPLAWLRALGWLLGQLLYLLAGSRRRVALTNLALCFPTRTPAQRRRLVRQSFVYFAQAWLDRSWLWHASPQVVSRRLRLQGAVEQLQGQAPTILFAPHFYGLDAGATALALNIPRRYTTIFRVQPHPALDAWVRQGRCRFGDVQLFGRYDGVKTIVASVRAGGVLYLLPDMNFGAKESIFVPFYGVPAATVPSLARFARLGKAQVVPVTTEITPSGYTTTIHPAWMDYPTDDVVADTTRMNQVLEGFIDTMPAQYHWVHKRFKTRPAGQPPVYGR